MNTGPRTFQLNAGNKWAIRQYKGKPRVVMNQSVWERRDKPIMPYDVLSVSKVRELAAWLARYLNMVDPTQDSVQIAGLRSHARGIDRNVTNLEANSVAQSEGGKADG